MAANIEELAAKIPADVKAEALAKRDVGNRIAIIRDYLHLVDDDAALVYKLIKEQ